MLSFFRRTGLRAAAVAVSVTALAVGGALASPSLGLAGQAEAHAAIYPCKGRPAVTSHVLIAKYRQKRAALGCPTTPHKRAGKNGTVHYQYYDRGAIFWHRKTGANEMHGEIWRRYSSDIGHHWRTVGFPVTDEQKLRHRKGAYNRFSKKAAIYWSPRTGAHEVHGKIYEAWVRTGASRSPAGLPIQGEKFLNGWAYSDFECARIAYHLASGRYWAKRYRCV